MSMLQRIKSPVITPTASDYPEDDTSSTARFVFPVVVIVLVLMSVAFVATRWDFMLATSDLQTTDDAYVRADISRLGSRVAGTVLRVAVSDYEKVQAGDLLLELDPADYLIKQSQAQAALDFADAALSNLQNQITLQRATIQQASAQKMVAESNAALAAKEARRQTSLVHSGSSTVQKAEESESQALSAAATAQAADAAVKSAEAQLAVIEGQTAQLKANVEAARSQLRSAELALGYTKTFAPFSGVVGETQLHVGDFVTIGTNVVTLIPLPRVFVIANFKETQLARMSDGQSATVKVDALPGLTLTGHVARMSPASGSQFALLPADNATGNFTKVVQRVPVRVELDPVETLSRLRPGMSATVSVTTSED
jgi:membrane fusion protein (multidrug efflux system)